MQVAYGLAVKLKKKYEWTFAFTQSSPPFLHTFAFWWTPPALPLSSNVITNNWMPPIYNLS